MSTTYYNSQNLVGIGSVGIGTTNPSNALQVNGTVAATSASITGAVTAATVTASGTISAASFAGSGTGLTGVNPLTAGVANTVVIALNTTTITSLPTGSAGQPLLSSGAVLPPAYGTLGVPFGGTGATSLTGVVKGTGTGALTASAVGLNTSDITGTLPVGNGGTGATSLTGVVKGNGTGALTASAVNLSSSDITGTLPIGNGGTGVNISTQNITFGATVSITTALLVGAVGQTAPAGVIPIEVKNNTSLGTAYCGSGWRYTNTGSSSNPIFNSDYITISASNSISIGGTYYAFSDKRIKKDIKDVSNSLELVKNINLKTYKYKDQIKNGIKTKYGFIAQDIQKYFPDVVSKKNEYIPNIFKIASNVHSNVITLENHGLLIDQKLKIIKNDNSEVTTTVCKVIDNNSFQISDIYNDSEVFVYGTEVDDFLSLDYDQLSTLAVGSVKELADIVKTQQKTIESLEARLSALEARMVSSP